MSKKRQSTKRLNKHISLFKCPICNNPFQVVEDKSLKCTNNHTFDITKQGYVNLMTHPIKSQYSKVLFETRYKIITESKLYDPLHRELTKDIQDYWNQNALYILDAGCGEGSHLQKVIDNNLTFTGIGIDITKEGIMTAAKNHPDYIWLVGDLAKSPFQDESFHVILNILSPANYNEFQRLLVDNGLVIKVVPRANYLIELRTALYKESDKGSYTNEDTIALFEKNFDLQKTIPLTYTKTLSREELQYLVQMTPLTWNADEKDVEKFLEIDQANITVDLDILIGRKKGY
jgi:23S rRNA (guanine745-N1)-methyltransferase